MAYLNSTSMSGDPTGFNWAGGAQMQTPTTTQSFDSYAGTPAAATQPATQPSWSEWYNYGVTDQANGNQLALPSFGQNEVGWTPDQMVGASGDNPGWLQPGSFTVTDPAAKDRLGQFYNMGSNSNNYMTTYDPNDPNNFKLTIKTGDKAGTVVPYTLKDGRWIPQGDQITQRDWNTNKNTSTWAPLAVLGAPLAYMGLTGALGAGAGAGTGATAGAAEGGVSMLPASNLFEGATLASGAPTSIAGGAAGAAGGAANWLDMLKGVGGGVEKLLGGGGGQPGQGGGGGGLIDWLGAGYSANRNRDYATKLMEEYQKRQAMEKPFYDKLMASYNDPNSFYQSNQYQGLKDVYQNQIDRKAAASGRMANPTDREVLLQKHAMSAMEDYRKGLQGDMDRVNPRDWLSSYVTGAGFDSFSNAPWFMQAGRQGTPGYNGGTQISNIYKTIKNAGSAAGDIWEALSGYFG